MNRFLKSKKEKAKEKEAKEAKEIREPTPTKQPYEPENSFSLPDVKPFKKYKNSEPEQKPNVDFFSALPSNDDFRTSLLMPKMSARFSMLKEQDDPSSLIGKASDDSVLSPKRASRLNLLGHSPGLLPDIDEVSLMDSNRPSFGMERGHSYGSAGANSDDHSPGGNIMDRPRPSEGNNLFGGRQKVFKIPVKSGMNSPTSEAPRSALGGRAVYEDDLGLSSFQRMRLKEKEDRAAQEAAEADDALSRVSSAQRTTYSSTASGPTNGRTSTAATSIDEPYNPFHTQAPGSDAQVAPLKLSSMGMGAERGGVRSRRLYGQGLAQSAQNQQSSALQRLESLSRQRAPTPEWPQLNRNFSKNAGNARDRPQKLNIAESTLNGRPTSPPSSATSPKKLNMDEPRPLKSQQDSHDSPPLSPPASESEEGAMLAASVQPEDRGKATAMGLFNKPNTRFDEQQFGRRQLQMHEGRNTPTSRQPSPSHATADGRSRGFSNTSHFSRPESASSHYSGTQRSADHSATPSVENSPFRIGKGPFLPDSSFGDFGEILSSQRFGGIPSSTSQGSNGRSELAPKPLNFASEAPDMPEVKLSDHNDLKPIEEDEAASKPSTSNEPASDGADSPTLGPSGLGLSGLVRTHLRRDSERSSIYPPPSPAAPPKPEDTQAHGPATQESQNGMSWQEEVNAKHKRDGSTETQKEREEFARELAERRRKVQEKMRNISENESRAGSPVMERHTPDPQAKSSHGLSFLKNKPGKHMFGKHEQKNGSVFGLGNASSPALAEGHSRDDEERMSYGFGKHSNSSSPHVSADRPSRFRRATVSRDSQDDSRESSRSRGPSPNSSYRSQSDRSGSEASARSKSHQKYRDRDDLGTLEEGTVSAHGTTPFPEYTDHRNSPSITSSVPSSARPSVEVNDLPLYDRSMSAASGRYRSGSRSNLPLHESTHFHEHAIGASPRPSPIAPYSANATPPLSSEQSPASSTPNLAATLSHGSLQQRTTPKRAINKQQISEPTFVSCTADVPTVDVAQGSNTTNEPGAPPVPPMNPRRRRQFPTHTILGAFRSDRSNSRTQQHPDDPRPSSEDVEKIAKPRNRLRKTSSEGGNLHSRARQEAAAGPSPPIPGYSQQVSMEGGMI